MITDASLFAAALFLSGAVAGCTTGLTGPDPFGLAATLSPPVAAEAVVQDEANGGTAEGASTELAQSSAPAAPEVAQTGGPAAPPASETASPSRTTIGSGTIKAAYAGASVGEGGTAGSAGGGSRSLFESLFAQTEARTPLPNADRGRAGRVVLDRGPSDGDQALPGVDASSLFEIGQRNSADEEIMEDAMASYQVASLSGFARLAPNGLKVHHESVETGCFPQKLLGIINAVERRFSTKVVVTSGYRSPAHNRRVNGATRSQHMKCAAADILIPAADRMEVARFVRSLPGRGGVGTYCHTQSIHVDVGPTRDWNWKCRRS